MILIAYAVAGVIGMIPITPGGLGIVEASLTGLLVLSEVNSSQAVLATLTYRLASYWLPLSLGRSPTPCSGSGTGAILRPRRRGPHPRTRRPDGGQTPSTQSSRPDLIAVVNSW